jgi:ABC-type transport system involved in Fe-S cluster assembly fused permease/ATPase subunit
MTVKFKIILLNYLVCSPTDIQYTRIVTVCVIVYIRYICVVRHFRSDHTNYTDTNIDPECVHQ